jgi:hypothetical protein
MSAHAHQPRPPAPRPESPAPSDRPEPASEAPRPPHDPSLRPTAEGAASVNRHYAEHEEEEEDDGGWFGGVTRLARRVTRRAEQAVRAAVPAVVREAVADTAAVVERAAEHAVSEAAQVVTARAAEAVETATAVVAEAEQTRRRVGRAIRESDVGSQVVRVHDEIGTFAEDLAEEAVDLGEGVADYVDEDVVGNGPRLDVAPESELPEIEEADAAAARQRAHDLFTATDGLGTDFAAVRASLRGLNADQIAVMEHEYYELTGQNMRAVLDSESSGADEREITGLLSGDPAEQAIAVIRGATTGVDTEDEVVREALRGLSPEDRERVEAELGADYFRDQLSGTAEETALLRLEGNETAAQAAEITDALQGGLTGSLARSVGVDGVGEDLSTVNAVLAEVPAESRAALETAVAERSANDQVEGTQSLTEMVESVTEPGAERNLTMATMTGDQTAIDAANLALNAEDHWYENPAVIAGGLMVVCPVAGLAYVAYRAIDSAQSGGDFMDTADVDPVRDVLARREGEDDEAYATRRRQLDEVYRREYGRSVDAMIDEEFDEDSSDNQFLEDLAEEGEVAPEVQLRYAFEGHLGTNDELALDALRDDEGNPLSHDEIARIRGVMPELEEMVEGDWGSEMSGDAGFEMRELLHGAPRNDAERLEAELRRDEWARGWDIARPLVDLSGAQGGRVLDEQRAELVRLQQQLTEDGSLPETEQIELRNALARHGTAESNYRARVDEMTEGVATGVGTAVAITAGIAAEALSAGLATPVVVALMVAAGGAGGLADLGVRYAMQGDRLSNEDIGQRLASTGINAATAGLGVSGVPGALLGAGLDEALQIGTGQRQMDDLGDVGAVGLRMGGAALAAHLGDRTAAGVSRDTGMGRVLNGAASGFVSGVVQPLANVETYQNGVQGALQTIGTSAADSMASGAVQEVASHHLNRRDAAGNGGDTPPPPPAHHDGDGGDGGPQARGIDARELLRQQAEHGSEIALSVGPDGEVAAPHVGHGDRVSVPEGHTGFAHTHPNASEDPRLQLPSDGQGDLGEARRHGNTQAVVHDEGVTVFHPGSGVREIDGLVGESRVPVGREADHVVIVPTNQVLLDQDGGSVVLWPSPDNPEQGMLPVQFPEGAVFGPGTSQANVDALAAHDAASRAEADRVAAASHAAETADAGRTVVAYDRTGNPIHEGDPLPAVYHDLEGNVVFADGPDRPPPPRDPVEALGSFVEAVPELRNRGFNSEQEHGLAAEHGLVFANEGDETRTTSSTHRGPNGETIVRVGTGDGAIVYGGENPQLVSTDFAGCGCSAIRGRMPDGTPVMLMNHVSEQDGAGHQARIGSDLDRLRRLGATNLEVTAVIHEAASRPAPADAEGPEAVYHGFPRELDLGEDVSSRVIRHDGEEHVHVLMNGEGTSVFRGDRIEDNPVLAHHLPVPGDPAEEFRAGLFDQRDPDAVPRTREQALGVRSERGGLSPEETRERYLARVGEIGGELEGLRARGVPLEVQARHASSVRHEARMVARGGTEDQVRSGMESIRDAAKYGHGDGPSFEQAVSLARRSLERDGAVVSDADVYREVIAASQRTDAETNAAAGQTGTASRSGRPRETADSLIDELLAQHRRELAAPYAD